MLVPRPIRMTLTSPRTTLQNHTLRSEEHTSELQSPCNLVCRLLLEKKKKTTTLHAIADRSHHITSRPPRCSRASLNPVKAVTNLAILLCTHLRNDVCAGADFRATHS